MSIKSDTWIKRMALEHRMIEPFEDRQVREGVVSFGLSSYGYDIRVADEFKVFTNINNTLIDPKNFDPRSFVDIKSETCIVPPNSFALARTVEYFRIPRDVLTVCLGKSTYARCGIIVNVTPFEPEWEGTATLEISNTTPLPAKIYANEGIAQVLFFQSDEPCAISYADKKGKYLKQLDVTLPRIEGPVQHVQRVPVVGGLAYVERVRLLPSSFTAALAPEPENKYFPHAIAVLVNGEKVGYVAPEVSRRYFAPLAARAGQPVTCKGRLAGPSDRETSGVALLLDFSALGVEPLP